MHAVGIGRVIFWPGGSLWIGKAFAPSELHAHHAVQISFALSGHLQFREDDEAPWLQYRAVLIPPDLSHTFQAPGQRIAHLFCGPETAVGRALLKNLGSASITSISSTETEDYAKKPRTMPRRYARLMRTAHPTRSSNTSPLTRCSNFQGSL